MTQRPPKPVTEMTESELEYRITSADVMIADFESKIKFYRNQKADAQTELEARQLAEYWKQHPELTPLAVGDDVLTSKNHKHIQEGLRLRITGISYDMLSKNRGLYAVEIGGFVKPYEYRLCIDIWTADEFRRASLQTATAKPANEEVMDDR